MSNGMEQPGAWTFVGTIRSLAYFLRGSGLQDNDIYVMINAYWEDMVFVIQEGRADAWRRVVDTGLASTEDIAVTGKGPPLDLLRYVVKARSVVVLER